ncbi:electron transfer flavoprotein subunit alpha/FixB family protein [Devosia sp.]|uniref:electron transfer flavoprotein subunit alpha/FixB family protein n=1 Tax=Devosia sp. TaxID=1871048 RepID=UPI003BA9766B
MTILLLAEHDNHRLDPQTARALTAARAMGGGVHILVAGSNCTAVAEAARTLGAEKVLLADAPVLAHQSPEALAALIVSLAAGYDGIVAAATSIGKSVLPRVAALLDVMQISEIVAVLAPDTFQRPIYAGNALETVQTTDPIRVVTIRAAAFAEASSGGAIELVTLTVPNLPQPMRFVSATSAESDRPELTAARVVISGGRAFGSKEAFDTLLVPLAAKLNAAIGASRAAVDAGYASNELQVGQTGKIVAPDLYIACGISGAIQHLAGMKESKVIVAINSDRDAPIFAVADYGLVGDLFTILPELTKAIG